MLTNFTNLDCKVTVSVTSELKENQIFYNQWFIFFFKSKELNPARVRLAQLSVMCKADMIHCAPRLSDSLNDSLCQSQPDKDWVLREAPTGEPSALSQSSLQAGRLIWDKVVVMCLLQISQDNQCHLHLEQQPSGWLLSLPSSFFETFQQCLPPPPPRLIAAKSSLHLQRQQSLPLAIHKGTHQTEQKDPKDWEECKAAKGIPEKDSDWWTGWWDPRKSWTASSQECKC